MFLSTYNTYFLYRIKYCRAINILFHTFRFDFEFFLQKHSGWQWKKHGNKINEPDINKIVTNDAFQKLKLRSKRDHYPLHSLNSYQQKKKLGEKNRGDLCAKLLTTENPLFNLLLLCVRAHIKRVRVIKCKKLVYDKHIWNGWKEMTTMIEMENLFIVIVIMNCLDC